MKKQKISTPTSTIGARALKLNGQDSFIYSGECHYFRIPKRYWEKHLVALADAGCNTVSSYVPWSWHESREGSIDLTGRTHPERDLTGFLDLARKHDLFVILKPGPYALAELSDQGMPLWLTRTYPEALALDENGEPWGPAYISYASRLVRRKSTKWLKTVVRDTVLPRQNYGRGAVIMMQLCNEIGMFQWLRSGGDYSKPALKAWREYLRNRFNRINRLEELLDRSLKNYAEVKPPVGTCSSRHDFLHYTLWHDFHRWLYADYVQFLVDLFRDDGVTIPFFTNVGGWVYGRAHEFPLNGTFQRETARGKTGLIYGVDHIPEFITPNNLHDGIVANEICTELQKRKGPLYSAELQCGSREFGVQPYPGEMGLFYRFGIIHGLTAMNFYMFSQGRNKKGQGIDGEYFYWFGAVDYRGSRQPMYNTIQRLGEWIKQNGTFVIQSKQPVQIGAGFYPPLHETEFLVPKLQKQTRLDYSATGFRHDPVTARDNAWFDGLIRNLATGSIPFELPDLTARSLMQLMRYKKLIVMSNEMMDAGTQTKLVNYVKKGGELILFPMFPEVDREFKACTILRKALGIQIDKPSSSNRISMNAMKDVPVPYTPGIIPEGNGRALAHDAKGKIIGIEKRLGKGSVRFFSFAVHYQSEDHPRLLNAMIGAEDLTPGTWTDPTAFHVAARFHNREGILFVGNFNRMTKKSRVTVKDPRGGDDIDLGSVRLSSQTGLLLPIQVKLSDGVVLKYACGELLGIGHTRDEVTISIRGPVETRGRLVINTRRALSAIIVDNHPVSFQKKQRVVVAEYTQTNIRQNIRFQFR